MSATVHYQVLMPIQRADGYCVYACDYDPNGVCRMCRCLDPSRFVVVEFPTQEQDKQRQIVERMIAAGITVHRVSASGGSGTE